MTLNSLIDEVQCDEAKALTESLDPLCGTCRHCIRSNPDYNEGVCTHDKEGGFVPLDYAACNGSHYDLE